MDANRFEALTRTLAHAATRRQLLRLLAAAIFSAWRAPAARGAQPGCAPGLADCGGRCVALHDDPFHCGACFNACAGVPPVGQSSIGACVDGVCRIVCEPGYAECGGRCVELRADGDGVCVGASACIT